MLIGWTHQPSIKAVGKQRILKEVHKSLARWARIETIQSNITWFHRRPRRRVVCVSGRESIRIYRNRSGAKRVILRHNAGQRPQGCNGGAPRGYGLVQAAHASRRARRRSARVYLDGILKLDQSAVPFGPGKIGYRYKTGEPSFSYTAFSNHASGGDDFETAKPLPGKDGGRTLLKR